jgi:hypothetical protein
MLVQLRCVSAGCHRRCDEDLSDQKKQGYDHEDKFARAWHRLRLILRN